MANEKILIVEDERIVAEELKLRIKSMGYQVVGIASTGEKAVELARLHHPDLILMDIKLKGDLDGIDAARIIAAEAFIPFIFLTANSDNATIQKAMLVRPVGYLLKPIDNSVQLRSTIEVGLYRYAREKKLKENEQWLNTTLKSMENGVLATDAACCVAYMNPAACLLSGFSPEQARGMKLADVLKLSDIHTDQEIEGIFERALTDEAYRASKGTATLKSYDGYEIPIDFVASPIKAEDGSRTGVLVVFNDITDKLRIEEALHASERKYRRAASACGEGVASIDDKNIVTYVNSNLASLFGHPERLLVGHSILSFLSPDSAATLQSKLGVENIDSQGRCELELAKRDCDPVWAAFKITPLRDKNRSYTGALLMVSDITDQKAKEARLQKALDAANQRLQIVDYRISALHRELQANLRYAGDLLRAQPNLDERCRLILDYPLELLETSMVQLDDVLIRQEAGDERHDSDGQLTLPVTQ